MAHIKDYLIGLREKMEKQYDREFACSKCDGKGFVEHEIMGDGDNFEWDVVDVEVVYCDECF